MLCLMMVHNSESSRQHQVPELSRGQDHITPSFDVSERYVKSGGNDSAFIDPSQQLDHYFAATMIVDDLELSNVPSLLHEFQEFNQHFRTGAQQNLFKPLVAFLFFRRLECF